MAGLSERHFGHDTPLLVGREREQVILRQALDEMLAGHGSLVLVSGEAGIGKTTLVDWLADQADEAGCLVLKGGCYDLTTTPPYGPWLEVIEHYSPTAELPPGRRSSTMLTNWPKSVRKTRSLLRRAISFARSLPSSHSSWCKKTSTGRTNPVSTCCDSSAEQPWRSSNSGRCHVPFR